MGIKDKCKGSKFEKILLILNLVAAGAIIFGIVVRFAYFGIRSDPFFYIMTIFLIPFCVFLILAELDNHKVFLYFRFLYPITGRGFYIIFVSLLLLEKSSPGEIIASIIVLVIGILNIVIGCKIKKQQK